MTTYQSRDQEFLQYSDIKIAVVLLIFIIACDYHKIFDEVVLCRGIFSELRSKKNVVKKYLKIRLDFGNGYLVIY